MTYVAPVAEQRFVLEHVVKIDELAATENYAAASPDMVDAIVEGAGAVRRRASIAPLNRIGDEIGAQWDDGVVTMPAGFREAYQAFVEGGWGSDQRPGRVWRAGAALRARDACLEDLGSANMAFSLCPMLTPGAIEALIAHGTDRADRRLAAQAGQRRMDGHDEPDRAAGRQRRRRAAHHRDARWATATTGSRAPRSSSPSASMSLPTISSTSSSPAPPARRRGRAASRCSSCPSSGSMPDGTPGEPNDVRCVSIEHKLGIHASPTCVLSYGDNGDCIGRSDRRRNSAASRRCSR